MAGSYLGIDFGNDSCKIAVREGGRVRFAIGHLPDNLMNEGEVVSPQTLSEFIRHLKHEKSVGGRDSIIALDEQILFYRHISMPPMSEGELKINLPYEFRDFIEGDPQSYTYDYMVDELVRNEDNEVEGMELYAAAIETSKVTERADILKRAGLRLRQAVPSPVALGAVLKRYLAEHPEHAEDSIAIVDLGYSGVQATFFHGTKYQSSKHIEMGCREIDSAIAFLKNVDPHVASRYKHSNYEDVLNDESCVSIYEQLCVEITKVINFYNFSNREYDLTHIFLMGGGGAIKQLEEAICESFDIQVDGIEALFPPEMQDVEHVRAGALAYAALLCGEEAK